jgi:hypothetical protein
MGGNTGNIRTFRISAVNGYRTLGSILADGTNGAGAGSTRRIYSYYRKVNGTPVGFYNQVLGLNYGEFRNRAQWFLSNPGY